MDFVSPGLEGQRRLARGFVCCLDQGSARTLYARKGLRRGFSAKSACRATGYLRRLESDQNALERRRSGADTMTAAPVYQASPIRRTRATKAEVEARREALLDIIEAGRPMTVRQVFYQATVRGLVEKAESGYGKVQTDLTLMRRDGSLTTRDGSASRGPSTVSRKHSKRRPRSTARTFGAMPAP